MRTLTRYGLALAWLAWFCAAYRLPSRRRLYVGGMRKFVHLAMLHGRAGITPPPWPASSRARPF